MNDLFDMKTFLMSHLPTTGRVCWKLIEPLVGVNVTVWINKSRRSYAPPTYVELGENGIYEFLWDVKEVRKYLADPKAYRAKAKPYAQLRYMWAGVLYDGYIPNTKTRKAMRLYSCKRNPKRAAQYFNQGYVFRNPDAVKVVKGKQPTPFKR